MKGKNFPFLFGVAILVFISGCVQTQPLGNTARDIGISTEVFEPTLSSVRSGEDVAFHIEVKNTGGYNDAPVVAELTGIDTQDWQIYDKYLDLGRLVAPDPETGAEGGTASGDWRGKAPSLRKGQVLDYTPIARVYYYYETHAVKPVWFVTSEELRRVVQAGGALQSEPTKVTPGPIDVEVEAGKFIRSTTNWENAKFGVEFRIINKGKGLIAGRDYPVYVEVEYPEGVTPVGECPPSSYGTGNPYENLPPGLNYPSFGSIVKLWNGKETSFTCEFQITNPPTNKELKNFKVKAGYVYYTDSETSISVTGTEEGFF